MIPLDSIKVGTLIIPVSNTNSHSYILGTTYRIRYVHDNNGFSAESIDQTFYGNSLQARDCVLANISKESMKESIKRLETAAGETTAEINYLAKRIRWMDFVGVEEFDEHEYKMHTVIENAIGQAVPVSRNKMIEISNRIKCELAPFSFGDTVVVGKRKLFIIYRNITSETVTLVDSEGTISYRYKLLESGKKVLTEKINPILNVQPLMAGVNVTAGVQAPIPRQYRGFSGTTAIHQIFDAR
jgi:hypothetical protein